MNKPKLKECGTCRELIKPQNYEKHLKEVHWNE